MLEKYIGKTSRNFRKRTCKHQRVVKINTLNAMKHQHNIFDHNFNIKNISQVKNKQTMVYHDNDIFKGL